MCFFILVALIFYSYDIHVLSAQNHFSSKTFTWSPPDCVPICLTLHLKMIEILSGYYKYKIGATKMMEYLLDNGKVLKKMAISSFPDEEGFMGLIRRFPKASVGCQILFSSPSGTLNIGQLHDKIFQVIRIYLIYRFDRYIWSITLHLYGTI